MVIQFIMAPLPSPDELAGMKEYVNEKDLHVIGAASAIGASFLLTLDRGLERELHSANFKFQTLSPGEFIKSILPHHVAYPRIRD
jgi:predicted nucleic acid-binding protein